VRKRTLGRSDLEVSAVGARLHGHELRLRSGAGQAGDGLAGPLGGGTRRPFFDTAQAYAPFTNEELVGEALAPFRGQVVIATKFPEELEKRTDL
jgi:aryl-alcohol dehydrogenase-like predicted oxidoreductase